MEINAKKSLGQNFLKDEVVLNKIIDSVNVSPDDLIIEIGPGKGALTRKLKVYSADIIAFEVDERLKDILKKLEDVKTRIVFADFLKISLSDYIKKQYKNIHIIANIPYYITNPIINKIISCDVKIEDATLMVQKEVALRLSSKPGHKSYGALTIFSNLDYEVKKLFDVSKYSFDPVPKVDSSVVQFNQRKEKFNISNYDRFSTLINNSFKSKRKTLKNNLKMYDWPTILNILNEFGYDENVRAEQIAIEDFVEISNKL